MTNTDLRDSIADAAPDADPGPTATTTAKYVAETVVPLGLGGRELRIETRSAAPRGGVSTRAHVVQVSACGQRFGHAGHFDREIDYDPRVAASNRSVRTLHLVVLHNLASLLAEVRRLYQC